MNSSRSGSISCPKRAPHLLEVGADGLDPLVVEAVEATRALGAVDHQPGVLEQPQVARSGGMPLGLFKGVRTYRVAPEGGRTRFTMREEYTGPLLPLIWRSMPDLQPSFDRFARGLKARVEGASSA
jgi:hypothetical protein